MKYITKRNLIIGVVTFLFGSLAGGWVINNNKSEEPYVLYKIKEVIDGDTVKLEDGIKVRLLGINTPEKGECFYEEAREGLRNQILGRRVRLDKDISEKDKYDRLLRYIVVEKEGGANLLVNDWLVREGFAFDISSAPDARYRDLLSSAEEEAKREKRGLWEECDYEEMKDLREKDAGPSDPNCIIKGNISEKGYGKTYLVPGCDNYNLVKIDIRKGEEYFCTEEKAVEAGFRKATNCP